MINLALKDFVPEKSMPRELRAVIEIFTADSEIKRKTLPFVNFEANEIDWYGIARQHFGSGHSAAIQWAKSIWMARQPENMDIFERSTSMDLQVRSSVIKGLAIAWGLI